MIFKKNFYLLFFFLFIPAIFQIVLSQDTLPTFVAKEADGIISVLRCKGLDITTYCQKFIDLNEKQISNGILLELGKTYKIPNSESSFRNVGRIINLSEDTEKPIFDFVSIILEKKDSTLKNRGAHQRLLVFDFDSVDFSKNASFSIAQKNTSQEGKNFAYSFENLF
jgi:hypothetical protein